MFAIHVQMQQIKGLIISKVKRHLRLFRHFNRNRRSGFKMLILFNNPKNQIIFIN